MRNLTFYLLSIALVTALVSCDRDSGPVMTSSPEAPSITGPEAGGSFQLVEDEADQPLFTMEWTETDYGFQAAVEYSVQMSDPEDNFEAYRTVATSRTQSVTITTGQMNSALLAEGYPDGMPAEVLLRVAAAVSGLEDDPQYSEPIMLTFTPYLVEVDYPAIYVPGGYQSASGYQNDWSPDVAPALYSIQDNDRYEGYVYMAGDNNEFKFTAERSWELNWGDDGADGTLQQDGANIVHPGPAYYKINVDLNDMTYTTLETSWGLIGDATPDGWDADQDMTYDPDEKVWTITLDLTAGEIKFRANDDWALNYGDNIGNGTLEDGGNNIPVAEAGNYTVILDLSGPIYTYQVIQN
ncbi:SusE domain-containing protein [Balneolaceae bacterium ANBcel3]|nr:SusE domain-containing protein [Balneolaceae bacterium ANBcel3]